MSLILNLDTATKACTVALWKDDRVIAQREVIEDGYTHAERLHVLIDEVINEAGISYSELDAIAVGKGPGSYTGLRIGVSAAKGLAYGVDIPLISLPTLQIMSAMALEHIDTDEKFLLRPLLDARRMEVYSAAYDLSLDEQERCRAHIFDEEERPFEAELAYGPVYFFGDGMEKCREILSAYENARFVSDVYPFARMMGGLAQAKLDAGLIEDTAYFEPFYLKEFVAKVGKKML
jgi:tRNA threonylcarbamoyladenosine biosynthesis protein TsaB